MADGSRGARLRQRVTESHGMRSRRMFILLRLGLRHFAAGIVLAAMATSNAVAADSISYSRDIRPILSEHCFKCHGPDDENRHSGLRLDVRESAIATVDSGL